MNVSSFWFTAETSDGQIMFYPETAPEGRFYVTSANEYNIAIDDDFETDLGWTVSGESNSPWERGNPQDEGGNWIPHDDYDGSGQCYVTGNQGAGGQNDLDGTTILTSPTLDASSGGTLSWAYWLSERQNNPHGPEDSFRLEASMDNGETWHVVREYTEYLSQGGFGFEERDFFSDPFTREELKSLIGSNDAGDFFSYRSPSFRKLGLEYTFLRNWNNNCEPPCQIF